MFDALLLGPLRDYDVASLGETRSVVVLIDALDEAEGSEGSRNEVSVRSFQDLFICQIFLKFSPFSNPSHPHRYWTSSVTN